VRQTIRTTAAPSALTPRLRDLGGISPHVLELALGAVQCGVASGDLDAPPTLTVIDYSRPSVEPRLWVFDLKTGALLFKELVAHGRNTGENMATNFSDAMNSHQSSLGLFVTGDTYVGSNGYSLRLDGREPGFNARARDRAIVMHGAPYVNAKLAAAQGRIGRSWGCPALREAVARDVIDTIRGGGVIFSYYPDAKWLAASRFLNGCGHTPTTVLATS
jgi:L,D-transpeptidase catalytic domain